MVGDVGPALPLLSSVLGAAVVVGWLMCGMAEATTAMVNPVTPKPPQATHLTTHPSHLATRGHDEGHFGQANVTFQYDSKSALGN